MRDHSLPHGWGRGTRQSEIVLENVIFQLTGFLLCGIYVTDASKLRSLPKRPPGKAVFLLSSAVRPNHSCGCNR
jgi:hypothetical protein